MPQASETPGPGHWEKGVPSHCLEEKGCGQKEAGSRCCSDMDGHVTEKDTD